MKIRATVDIVIIVDDDSDDYEDMKRQGVLKANEIVSLIPNATLTKVEVQNGYLLTEIKK